MDSLYIDTEIPTPPLSEPAFFESLPDFLKEPTLNRFRWTWRFDEPEKADQMRRGYLRMLSGVEITRKSLENAEEMILNAQSAD